ncbi:MAG: SPOR domain-containing protein [Flavobacteriaceae bacterium]
MLLDSYIKDLLYRYDCVIVPEFGAFVTNKKSATIKNGSFQPPFKQLTFNPLIQNNDGLLANHIASTDKMPYRTAVNYIKFEVETWIEKLMDDELELKDIGIFSMENDTIFFEPNNKVNYLTSSFGLSSYITNAVERRQESNEIIEKSIVLNNQRSVNEKQTHVLIEKESAKIVTLQPRNKRANFLKYAAIFLLSSSIIGLAGTSIYKDQVEKQEISKIKAHQKQRNLEIQTATFVIKSPLPTITLNSKPIVDKYHIIAGAFRNENNALKKINQLKLKGFNASIVGKNKWNLTQVAFDSFSSLEKANESLNDIKKTVAKDAWLLIKE